MQHFIQEEVVHISGIPKKLIIFLHGYIDTASSLDRRMANFVDSLRDVAIHVPQAPIICEIHECKRQWYSMHRFDPNDDRKTVESLDECVAFYDKMRSGLEEAAFFVNEYIDNCLQEYQLEEKDLYLCGFSQGAMLALYISLMRENKVAGCISFSGILAAHSYLLKHHKHNPDMLLIHGDKDNLIRFEALDFTKQRLEGMGCIVKTHTIKDGQHKLTDEAFDEAVKFIKNISQKEDTRAKVAV